jgi:hypothetical protein
VRWFGRYGYYKIVDDSDLIIYSKRISGKRTFYYYSKTLDCPIKRIQPKNIRDDFAEYPEFVKLASTACKTNAANEVRNGRTILNDLYARKVSGNEGR